MQYDLFNAFFCKHILAILLVFHDYVHLETNP